MPQTFSSLLELSYIDVLRVFDSLQQAKGKNNRRKYTVKTIQATISEARLFFDWLKVEKNQEPLINPFRRLKFHNVQSFVGNTNYIPAEVVEQLLAVIDQCPVYVQRMWIIMMNTGMRISEALSLKENCLSYNEEENTYYLRFIATKTLKSRRRIGLNDYHSVPIISEEIIKVIREQINETKSLRESSNTQYIFIKMANSKEITNKTPIIRRHKALSISGIINRCIKRNQIKDRNGELWHYTHHQCRKTLAVKLLSQGSPLNDVGEILGHTVEKTTRQYYQDIDDMKIAELDKQLFQKLFDTIDIETKNTYTSFEFDQLKREVAAGSRETPEGHGSCIKHVSFGPCKKSSCVGCSLLLTGPQKLPMWQKLHQEQQLYMEDMTKNMKRQGINDYENYRDYQAEQHLLTLYKDTISKIEKFVEERIPNYAKQ